MRIKKDCAETKIEETARLWLNRTGADGGYDDGAAGAYRDLMQGGCASGIVSDLIYHADTVAFYKRHASEIDAMLRDACDDSGCLPGKLFERSGWDDSDPLARDTTNQNILAWFGFEEAARTVANRAGLED